MPTIAALPLAIRRSSSSVSVNVRRRLHQRERELDVAQHDAHRAVGYGRVAAVDDAVAVVSTKYGPPTPTKTLTLLAPIVITDSACLGPRVHRSALIGVAPSRGEVTDSTGRTRRSKRSEPSASGRSAA